MSRTNAVVRESVRHLGEQEEERHPIRERWLSVHLNPLLEVSRLPADKAPWGMDWGEVGGGRWMAGGGGEVVTRPEILGRTATKRVHVPDS